MGNQIYTAISRNDLETLNRVLPRVVITNKIINLMLIYSEIDLFELLLGNKSLDLEYLAIEAAQEKRYDVVELLLEDGRINPDLIIEIVNDDYLLKLIAKDQRISHKLVYLFKKACSEGYTDLLLFLLSETDVDPTLENNYGIKIAVENSDSDIVEILLKDGRVDPQLQDNYLIITASENGESDIVEVLLKDGRADPQVRNNYPICIAARKGHSSVVYDLLSEPRVDPSVNDKYALRVAIQNQDDEIIEMLEEDEKKYPTYEIRQHNLPLDIEIENIKSKILEFKVEENFYIQRFQEIENMHKNNIPVNRKAEMVVDLHLQILNSEIGKLIDKIKNLNERKLYLH